MKSRPKRIVHLITGLNTGGAESMLFKLVCFPESSEFEHVVISLMNKGTMGAQIEEQGVKVFSVGDDLTKFSPKRFLNLYLLLRKLRPNLVMGWMYHGNVISMFSKLTVASLPIVWNIRHTPGSLRKEKKITAFLLLIGAKLSFIPKTIIFNSQNSLTKHKQLGYSDRNLTVIPNGFDTRLFNGHCGNKYKARAELKIPEDHFVIGHVARFHPMKDHKAFIEAAGEIAKHDNRVIFVLAGREVVWENRQLSAWIDTTGQKNSFVLLGEILELHKVYPAFNLLCLSSAWGEGFPNVLGEAMSSKVPCVTTNVGDSALIVGDSGVVVPPGNPKALAHACIEILSLEPEDRMLLGKKARRRIQKLYSLKAIAKRYNGLYSEIFEN